MAASSGEKFSVLQYNLNNFNFIVNDSDKESEFDSLIKQKWESAMKENVFRYQLNITESKRVAGEFEFLAQLNLDRSQNRRSPENITSMLTPFDEKRFNFTKINSREILFDVDCGDGNNVIAVNVSPLEYGHCLFIPDRLKCLPQTVTKSSLLKIVELFLLSQSPYLRAVFNSLCAYASVNHLHWHLYYLKHKMLLETVDLECLADPLYALINYPAKGFCFKLSSFPDNNIRAFVSSTFALITYLQEHEIAHNIYITRAKLSSADNSYNDVRIYIWARKSSLGIKDTSTFIPAVCELFGHLVIRSEHAYRSLNETEIIHCLNDVTSGTFESVVQAIKSNKINITSNVKTTTQIETTVENIQLN